MNKIKLDTNKQGLSTIFKRTGQEISHMSIEAGKKLDIHDMPWSVVIIPIEGTIRVHKENESYEELKPYTILTMEPHEKHYLETITDAEIIIVKSTLK